MKRVIYILLGCFITGIGTIFLQYSHLVIGGTAGLSLSLSYLLQLPFSLLFFMINIPFYLFSIWRMGWNFTLVTFFAVTAMVVVTAGIESEVAHFTPDSWVGAVVGGGLCGIGLTILFSNKASLGGANILALYLEEKYGWNPGLSNFVFDAVVVAGGIYSAGLLKGIYSVVAVLLIASIISLLKRREVSTEDCAEL